MLIGERWAGEVVRVLLRVCLIGMVLTVGTPLFSAVAAGDSGTEKLRTGRSLQRVLEGRRALSVQAAPVREVLLDLQEQTEICIVVDRRMDPSQRLTINTGLVSTEELLRQVAAELPDAEVSVNRSFVYIGPAFAARRLRTLCEQKRSWILEARRLFKKETYAKVSDARLSIWGDLRSPGDLVAEFASAAVLTITNPEAIPYDLWHAGRFSPMPFAESSTLVLNQFDLTFEIDAVKSQVGIIPVPQVVLLEKRHSVRARRRAEVQEQLSQKFPTLDATWSRSAVHVHATYEQHEEIAVLLSGSDPTEDSTVVIDESLKTRLFTLSLPEGVTWRGLMSQLEKSGVEIRVESDLEDFLDQEVSGKFTRLPGTQFFPQLFSGLPVRVQVLDKKVVLWRVNLDE